MIRSDSRTQLLTVSLCELRELLHGDVESHLGQVIVSPETRQDFGARKVDLPVPLTPAQGRRIADQVGRSLVPAGTDARRCGSSSDSRPRTRRRPMGGPSPGVGSGGGIRTCDLCTWPRGRRFVRSRRSTNQAADICLQLDDARREKF